MSSDYSIVIGFIIIILIFISLHHLQNLNSDKIESYAAAAPNPMQAYTDMYAQSIMMMLMPWMAFACPKGTTDSTCTICNCPSSES